MIKEQSFEWLLKGCHRIADVAVAYYPNYAYACSAIKGITTVPLRNTLPAEGSDGPGLSTRLHLHPRTDRHPPELLGDARPREGYDREKSVSSGL